MDYTDALTIITSNVASFGLAALAVLTACISLGVALLVVRYGWWKLAHDQSLEIGGYYVRNLPFKGYHRFRSKTWNMKHMP